MAKIVNLYIVATPLQYLAAELIRDHFEAKNENHLFYLLRRQEKEIDPNRWTSVSFLPWPRKYPKKGLFGIARRIKENLRVVAKKCEGAKEIQLHSLIMSSESINYNINYLRHNFPEAEVTFRLIPDGTSNLYRRPMHKIKEYLLYIYKIRLLFGPDLNYYTFSGDPGGCDADITDKIYVLHGMPHEYTIDRVVELPPLKVVPVESVVGQKRAFVVGQPPHLILPINPEEGMKTLADGIHNTLKDLGITQVDYKAHPKDQKGLLSHPSYRAISINEPLEKYLASHYYHVIIGVSSTTLFIAKLMYGDKVRVISYGHDLLVEVNDRTGSRERNKKLAIKEHFNSTMKKLGIEQINYF